MLETTCIAKLLLMSGLLGDLGMGQFQRGDMAGDMGTNRERLKQWSIPSPSRAIYCGSVELRGSWDLDALITT